MIDVSVRRGLLTLMCLSLSLSWLRAESVCDTLPESCGDFVYMLRVKARSSKGQKVEVAFGNGVGLKLTVPSLADAADGHSYPVKITATGSDGVQMGEGVAQVSIDPTDKGFSLRLSGDRAGLGVSVGGPHAEGELLLPGFDTQSVSSICATLPEGAEIMRRSLRCNALAVPCQGPFASLEELRTYLSASTDPREGYYVYLDKDIKSAGSAGISRPEAYKFALTRVPGKNDSYSYFILFLEGAQRGWKSLEVKGSLEPTGFINHFNLRWVDANRVEHSTDTYAEYSENGYILATFFPLLEAKIRFRRVSQY